MKFERASGILLHPTSLPGSGGIGNLGPAAFQFVDRLVEAGQSLWQVLPLGPTGYGDSPYQCFSAFAGNPLLVSPELLVAEGLLSAGELGNIPSLPEERVDYGVVIDNKSELLGRVYATFLDKVGRGEGGELLRGYETFCEQSSWWLDDYALFRSIKDEHGGQEWTKWESGLRDREPASIRAFLERRRLEVDRHRFLQFLFIRQWIGLARYANERGVKIIGDIPIFVAHDSADVWSNRELYHLDSSGMPTCVAGVPPDYFSADGQLWGNPLYRWDLMAENGYSWWITRIRSALTLFDIVRLDHFRGFEKFWTVPAGETTARSGEWVLGPGADFFGAVESALGTLPIIAEDLGLITDEVRELRDRFNLPGMHILQFAFSRDPGADHLKPYRFNPNSVVYTGTHDNDTARGWFEGGSGEVTTRSAAALDDEREFLLRYLGTDGQEINWDMIRMALASVADLAIIPMQDLMGLGSEARMNTPSRQSGNWSWRCRPDDLTSSAWQRLGEMTEVYGRNRRRRRQEEESIGDQT